MSVFVDKRFEELDWISKAVEPVECALNEIIGYLPEEIDITENMILKTLGKGRHEIHIFDLIVKNIKPEHRKNIERGHDQTLITKSYEIEFRHEDGSAYSPDDEENYLESGPLQVKFDSKTNKLTGKVVLVKKCSGLDQDEIKLVFGKKGYEAVSSISSYSANYDRVKEVLEMLGPIPDLIEEKTSSRKKKLTFLRKTYSAVVNKNIFNIKNVDLMDKLGEWINLYVMRNDQVAFANICKLKIMATLGAPIYSMEIEVAKNDAR